MDPLLFQVHLDGFTEANHGLECLEDGLVVASEVRRLDERTVELRRPYFEACLGEMYQAILPSNDQMGKAVNLICDGRILSHWEVKWLCHQLIVAIQRLHQSGLYHGSLHPGNIMLDPSTLLLSLVDPSPFKAYWLCPEGDPAPLLYYYHHHHSVEGEQRRFIPPERLGFEGGSEPSGVEAWQKADLYALGIILRDLLGDSAPLRELIQSRIISSDLSLVSSSVTNVILPLLRHFHGHRFLDLEAFARNLDDLGLLSRTDPDFKRILCRFLLGHVQRASDETQIIRILHIVRKVAEEKEDDDGDDIFEEDSIFYLKTLKELQVTEAISSVCDQLLRTPGRLDDGASGIDPSFGTTGQLLRSLKGLTASKERESLLKSLQRYYPAVLIHPVRKVREMAIGLIKHFSQCLDPVDRLAYLFPAILKALAIPVEPFDPAQLDPADLVALLKTPMRAELLELVQQNLGQVPRLYEALSPEDLDRTRLILSIVQSISDGRIDELPVLRRKDLGINPVILDGSDHESFSPLLSPVDSLDAEFQTVYQIPTSSDPLAYRHFQRRSLPFQFGIYEEATVSPLGDFFALRTPNGTEVWRVADFRSHLIPDPWVRAGQVGPCYFSQDSIFVLEHEHDCIHAYDLKRRNISRVIENAPKAKIIRPISKEGFIMASSSGLSRHGAKVEWTSENHPYYHGVLMHLVVSSTEMYAVSASSAGYICLWDLRYGLALRSWRLPLDLASIRGLAFLQETGEDGDDLGSFLLPPKLWILSEANEQPVVLLVDLALAQIVNSSVKELMDLELLEDKDYDLPPSLLTSKHSLLTVKGAEWILIASALKENSGQLLRCLPGPESIECSPLRLPFTTPPIQSVHALLPSSVESSRNLSFLVFSLQGSCFILECFK